MGRPPDPEKRKRVAREAFSRAVSDRRILGGLKGLKCILTEEIEEKDYPEDFFDVLTDTDLLQLYIEAVDMAHKSEALGNAADATIMPPAPSPPAPPPVNPSPIVSIGPNKPVTPPSSDKDGQSVRSDVQTAASNDEKEQEEGPHFDEDVEPFNITLFHAKRCTFRLATAKNCTGRKCYIADTVVRSSQNSRQANNFSVWLAWEKLDPPKGEPTRTPYSRFTIIEKDKMNCDVAIGVGWDDPDEEEDHQNEADGEVEAVDQFDLVMPDNYGLAHGSQSMDFPGRIPDHVNRNAANFFLHFQTNWEVHAWNNASSLQRNVRPGG